MSEIEWSSNAVRVLVAQYERRPALWDRAHALYRAGAHKHRAWLSLAKIFSCDVTELRKKFNSVLASYRRERGKVKEGGRSGWFLYPHMAFLPGYLRNPPPAPRAPRPPQEEEEAAVEEERLEPACEGEEEEEGEEELYRYETDSEREEGAGALRLKREPASPPAAPAPAPPPAQECDRGRSKKRLTRTLKRRRARGGSVELRPEGRLRGAGAAGAGAGAGRDDCDTYGEYIAATLRQHDHKARCLLKQAINNVLFEHEMSRYSPLHAPAPGLDEDE